MIVLDASVLIGHFEASDAAHERATALLREVAEDDLRASPITLAEVLVGPARRGALDLAESLLQQLGVIAVPLAADGPRQLAAIQSSTGLKLPDCCVVLAAEQLGGSIATFDDRLAVVGRARGIAVLDRPPGRNG